MRVPLCFVVQYLSVLATVRLYAPQGQSNFAKPSHQHSMDVELTNTRVVVWVLRGRVFVPAAGGCGVGWDAADSLPTHRSRQIALTIHAARHQSEEMMSSTPRYCEINASHRVSLER